MLRYVEMFLWKMLHESHEQGRQEELEVGEHQVPGQEGGQSNKQSPRCAIIVLVFTHRAIGRKSWEVLGASNVFHEGITVRARLFWVAK